MCHIFIYIHILIIYFIYLFSSERWDIHFLYRAIFRACHEMLDIFISISYLYFRCRLFRFFHASFDYMFLLYFTLICYQSAQFSIRLPGLGHLSYQGSYQALISLLDRISFSSHTVTGFFSARAFHQGQKVASLPGLLSKLSLPCSPAQAPSHCEVCVFIAFFCFSHRFDSVSYHIFHYFHIFHFIHIHILLHIFLHYIYIFIY